MNYLSFVKKHPVSQKIILFVLSLYLILWALSSPVIKHFLKPIINEQGLSLSSGSSISFNPFITQITIRDLTVLKGDDKVLSAQELILRVTLYRLLFDEISVSKFTLNDGFISIKQTEKLLTIAGIDIKQGDEESNPSNISEENSTENQPINDSTADSSEVFPYQLLLPKLIFNNIAIDINNNNKPHHVKLKQLIVDNLSADVQSQQASIKIHSLIDKTEVTLTANAEILQDKAVIHSQLSISEYPVNKLTPYVDELSELSGLFSLTSTQSLFITPKQIKLHIPKAKLNNKNLIVNYQQQFLTLENLQSNITDLALTLQNGKLTALAGTGQLSMKNANVYYQEAGQKLGHFDQLTLTDIGLHLEKIEQVPTINISSLQVDGIVASKNEILDLPPIAQLNHLSITNILLNEKHINVDKVILDSLTADIVINKEKALSNLVTLPIAKAEQEKITQLQVSDELEKELDVATPEMLFSLGEFSLINDNQIVLLDNSVEPIKERKLYIDTLYLGSLSNVKNKKEQQTPFEIAGRSNKYAHFDFKGFTQPFAMQPTHHLQGYLKELSLPALSRYMKQAMQMELKSGQLNTDINITLAGEQLDGNIVLLVQGLETAMADSHETGALIDQGALPFNIALGILKDSQGNVELDVPVSGSTSDPSFGISSIVTLITQKAIWMATQDYLMTTFIPYANIVSAAMTVGEFALKLRFDDLIYQEKQIAPNKAQQAYLDAFIALMQDKDDIRVNICAISTPADIDLVTEKQVKNKDNIRQLKDIAEKREATFKEYIIKHGNIASSRLLLCAPKIDSSNGAKPRIELSV